MHLLIHLFIFKCIYSGVYLFFDMYLFPDEFIHLYVFIYIFLSSHLFLSSLRLFIFNFCRFGLPYLIEYVPKHRGNHCLMLLKLMV